MAAESGAEGIFISGHFSRLASFFRSAGSAFPVRSVGAAGSASTSRSNRSSRSDRAGSSGSVAGSSGSPDFSGFCGFSSPSGFFSASAGRRQGFVPSGSVERRVCVHRGPPSVDGGGGSPMPSGVCRTSGRRSGWSKSSRTPSGTVSASSAWRSAHRVPYAPLFSSSVPARGRISVPASPLSPSTARSARSPSGAATSAVILTAGAEGCAARMRRSLTVAMETITARLEISATPAPVSPMRGSSNKVSPSTRKHNSPWR